MFQTYQIPHHTTLNKTTYRFQQHSTLIPPWPLPNHLPACSSSSSHPKASCPIPRLCSSSSKPTAPRETRLIRRIFTTWRSRLHTTSATSTTGPMSASIPTRLPPHAPLRVHWSPACRPRDCTSTRMSKSRCCRGRKMRARLVCLSCVVSASGFCPAICARSGA